MADILITKWVIVMVLIFEGVISKDINPDIELKQISFKCNLNAYYRNWSMQCESSDNTIDSESSNFYIVNLNGIIDAIYPVTFKTLLNSTLLSKSEFYSCDNIWKDFIKLDPSILTINCMNYSKFLHYFKNNFSPSSITRITLSNISKYDSVSNILYECCNLNEIRICDNILPDFSILPIKCTNSLHELTLENNQIENISNTLFYNFLVLEILDLSNNLLKYINENFFGNVTTISTLELSFNLIEFISDEAFSNLIKLKNLYLQNNNIKYIKGTIFKFNSFLCVLNLDNNSLKTLSPSLFQYVPSLQNISCTNCSLVDLYEDLFINTSDVISIYFNNNRIQEISEKLFRNVKRLKYLDLSSNKISNLNQNIFKNLTYLSYLNISRNNISYLKNGVFDQVLNVWNLDLSENKIKILNDEHIKKFNDLEHLDLRRNLLSNVELGITADVKIRNLLLSDNQISYFNVQWKRLSYLETLEIDNNKLKNLALPPCIPSVKQTITFSFKYNNISRIDMQPLLSDEIKARDNDRAMAGCFFNGLAKNFIDLMHNPLQCDCELYSFYNYLKLKSPRPYQMDILLNKHNLTCGGPPSLKGEKITSLPDDVFGCLFSENCPYPCTCGIRGKDNLTFANCSSRNLKDVPQSFNSKITVLYFNNNKLKTMSNFNNKGWCNLKELHIDGNLLSNLSGWDIPSSLHYLSARRNKLKTLSLPLMQYISNQSNFQLFFGGNDKNCNCSFTTFKKFLIENSMFIQDEENILCEVTSNDTSVLLPLPSIPDSVLCPVLSNSGGYNEKRIIIFVCLPFTFLILMVLLYYKQRQLILSFLYIHCDEVFRICFAEDECDDKSFDAFVAYSSSDRDIVMEILDVLESNVPYFRLCIHERDWIPGHFISDNIINSVQSSRRTIVVLSNAFLRSPWFNLELRAAVCKMSKDKHNRVIVVLTEKSVSFDSIDPELRSFISKRTYLVWGERWFWEKLRYVMPRKRNVKSSTERMCSSSRTTSELSLMPEANSSGNML